MTRWPKHSLLVLLIALLGPPLAAAQVPAASQALLLLRTLAFDRKVGARADGAVKIAIIYRAGASESESAHAAITSALEAAAGKNTVSGMQVHPVSVPYTTAAKFELPRGTVAAYVCPGLGDEIEAISRATQSRGSLTFTDTEAYVKGGLSIGLVRRDTKAAILVNLRSSRAEGADLDSALLRIAEVIR